ncbi:MAG: DUF134 domain-containing protein [Candidatus Omnitrophota bacterium]
MRPVKTRWVECAPGERCFRPQCKPLKDAGGVYLTIDEFEAVRLADVEGLKQEDAAKKMRISRPTFSRIINSAHGKIGDAIVNIKAIKIGGGCCKIEKKKKKGK